MAFFLASRPVRTSKKETVEPEQQQASAESHIELVKLAAKNVLADLLFGFSPQVYSVYDAETVEHVETVHIHNIHDVAEKWSLNMKLIAATVA